MIFMHSDLINWYKNITRFKGNKYIAPHKPLTILFALANVLKGMRWIDFIRDKESLEKLIQSNSNTHKVNCLNPLWRLVKDNQSQLIWVAEPIDLKEDKSGNILITEARQRLFKAGFSDHVFDYLSNKLDITQYLILEILEDNFPETIMNDILDYLGIYDLPPALSTEVQIKPLQRYKRDPKFRLKVMEMYDSRCCFCNLKISLNYQALSMEAAHIKWKAEGGECHLQNGISLCPTHHLTFDRGIWTLNSNYEIELSPFVVLDQRSDIFFKPFIGHSIIKKILDQSMLPLIDNLMWHRENIFKK